MANYEIHIQDVDNVEDDLILHYAERDAIELNWLGGDSKTQPIVGSELNFSLEAGEAEDATFIELFTLDEKKWLVTLRISENQNIVWQGYVLPESYREPYRNSIFYVQVSAVDGLGLLKGVKLPDSFYNDEKTVMQVLCEILKLTKVDLELFFSPAILNANEPDWNKIFVDTLLWDKQKDNAYELLKDLMESMRCQVFQCEGRWYIEGFNKKQLLNVTYEVYEMNGTYLRTQSIEKTIKQIPLLATPEVSMVPGIKEAVVTYERNPMEFPKDNIQETNRPWVVYSGQVDNLWLAKHWNYKDEFLKIYPPESKMVYRRFDLDDDIDTNRFITTRDKYFVRKNATIKINLGVKVFLADDIPEDVLTDAMIRTWQNRQIYEVRLDGDVIITNLNVSKNDPAYLVYDNDGTAEVELFVRPEKDGLLDLKFYEPTGNFVTTRYRGTQFEELTIEVVPEVKEEVYTVENTDLGSNVSDFTIRFGDDPTLFTEAFYLQRTRQLSTIPKRFWFEVFFYKVENGVTYAIIPLRVAVLAYRLRFESFKALHVANGSTTTGQVLDGNTVVFNYEDGEGSAIEVPSEFTTGHILINIPNYIEETQSRLKNTQWTDALIGVQKERYGQIVGEIEKKIYETPHFTFEGSTDRPLKFNDIIKYKYFNEQRFFSPSNLSWRPDGNTSDFLLNELLYQGVNSELIPPFVDAGDDIIIGINDSVSFLSAVASAPSGTIEDVQWTIIQADDTINIINPSNLDTEVDSLDTDFYTFRVTVTDSNGLTAFDEVNVIRVAEALLVFTETERIQDESEDGYFMTEIFEYQLEINPDFETGERVTLLFNALIDLFTNNVNQPGNISARIKITKNGTDVFDFDFTQSDMVDGDLAFVSDEAQLSLDWNDTVVVRISTRAEIFNSINNETAGSIARFQVNSNTSNSNITLTNLPITEQSRSDVFS